MLNQDLWTFENTRGEELRLRASQKRLLPGRFELRGVKRHEAAENVIMGSFMVALFTKQC
jgi:hypothetical protein